MRVGITFEASPGEIKWIRGVTWVRWRPKANLLMVQQGEKAPVQEFRDVAEVDIIA